MSASLRQLRRLTAATLIVAAMPAHAVNLYDGPNLQLDLGLTVLFGAFHSENAYALVRTEPASPTWFEGYAEFHLNGEYKLSTGGTLFGGIAPQIAANRGDGDAAGYSAGREEDVELESLYIGWRTNSLVPWLGGIEVSIGRQDFKVGRGFLISGDIYNFGEGYYVFNPTTNPPTGLSRGGGTYYLAARSSFDNTVILSVGGEQGFHGDAFWLQSHNRAQAEMAMAGVNLEYRGRHGTLGALYLKGLDVHEDIARFLGYLHRDGQATWAIRGHTDFGINKLYVAGEYVTQDNGNYDAHAWYGELGWTFDDVAWSPSLTYRFSSYSEGYDPLFYGGTWFHGLIAANYAGPFNRNSDIHLVGLALNPTTDLTFGARISDFNDTAGGSLNAEELELYASWTVNDHLTILPLVSFYNPEHSAQEGGTQISGEGTNLFTQVVVAITF